MKFLLKGRYAWHDIHKEINALVEACSICIKSGRKMLNTKNRVIITNSQNELWEVDLIGRIPGDNTNSFILVAIDHYTKWIETKFLSNKSGDKVAKAIEEIIIKKHGTPDRILSDCELEFKNSHIVDLQKKYGIKWSYSSPEHHNTVGAVERVNKHSGIKSKNSQNLEKYLGEKWLKKLL